MNRYIRAMEVGNEFEDTGITYFDLLQEMHGTKEKTFSSQAEYTFFLWFIDNFSCEYEPTFKHTSRTLNSEFLDFLKRPNLGYHQDNMTRETHKHLSQKFFLNGQASKQYLDYQELQQSRMAANRAQDSARTANEKSTKSIKLAIVAIIISALLGIASILVPLYLDLTPKPPYDVKIIEDMTRVKNLETENKVLKDKLYRAELMIEVYESENE